ncbi:toll/interleukin-1 receptor domain-containing protein [Xylanivirga thermophila]|uniref:toll/interleukin-1 receptor domain-containing protein n=1 Tax=Xylanivirga thermophila TaxID=2496273 RepID=UPI0013ED6732|nr:toll/interleukin-1 receptor domain-containing protein [Xylanivirga thermophila]
MKENLLNLLRKTDEIQSYFYFSKASGFSRNIIYNKPEFINWKQELIYELSDIYKTTNDEFINKIIILLEKDFIGWRDEILFKELRGNLMVLEKNIDKYFPKENDVQNNMIINEKLHKKTKTFISHSNKDIDYVEEIVKLLESIGLRAGQLFCSSIPGYGIPLGEDIYDFLKVQFQRYNLHIIFVLSKNYYDSIACLNEMGAAWILQNNYTTILLPDFEFQEIQGAINPRKIALKLDGDKRESKEKLHQLKELLIKEFDLGDLPSTRWEEIRDRFLNNIVNKEINKNVISDGALKILTEACSSKTRTILFVETLSGKYIQVNNKNYDISTDSRLEAKWEGYLEELVNNNFIKAKKDKGELFMVTSTAYEFIDNFKE